MLTRCLTPGGEVDLNRFDEFRHGLAWLIAVEQRILLPTLIGRLGPLVFQKGMQRDHRDLITLCVASPDSEWVENLAGLLGNHLKLEEGREGLLELVERHLADEPGVLEAIDQLPFPRLPPLKTQVTGREQLRAVLVETGLADPG